MKTIHESVSTPKADGYRMPGEFEPQECIWMLWPHRPDNWRDGAKPAQKAYADVARGIAQYEPVIVGVNPEDYAAAHYVLTGEENILVVEMTSDDSWIDRGQRGSRFQQLVGDGFFLGRHRSPFLCAFH